MTGYVIRPAEEKDCDQIMELLLELAEFENLRDQVEITADVLRKDGFGAEPCFQCIVAELQTEGDEEPKEMFGYALFSYSYYSWKGKCCFLDGLYVSPLRRGKGAGTALLAEVTKIALSKGCLLLQWAALNWNESALEFYESHGATNATEKKGVHLFRMMQPHMKELVAKYGVNS